MDLILALICMVAIMLIKGKSYNGTHVAYNDEVNSSSGETSTALVGGIGECKVGHNLMLKKESRAFFKIIDELGLG